MKILYYDCFCGISGDMNLGALIDLGVDKKHLKKELSKINLNHEFEINFKSGMKNGISGIKANVVVKSHNDTKEDEHHHHHHRTYKTIKEMIENSSLSKKVKKMSIDMFYEIALAEGKVHGKPIDEVHFHEVGAVDSIVDIIGCAICLEYLNVDKIISSEVQLGGGFVSCQHGKIPVPAPATVEILKDIPVKTGLVNKETTTPTGAAILKSNVDLFSNRNDFIIKKIGYGLGTRNLDIPNVLRVYIGDMKEDNSKPYETKKKDSQYIIETNIDDMNSELFSYIENKLFENGALDVYKTPIIMKKGRPAVKLSVLTQDFNRKNIIEVIFNDTTAGGVREYKVVKHMMAKKYRKINSKYGLIQVKDYYYEDRCLKTKAEFDDCERLAIKNNISIGEIYNEVNKRLDLRGENE